MLLLPGLIPTLSGAADWGPWETPPPSAQRSADETSEPFDRAVRNFQKYISPLDGARCPMYPTCSAYARQALHKHGALLGIFMTVDRLLHEGDPREQQEPLIKWGQQRYFDPLHYNDFWIKTTRTD